MRKKMVVVVSAAVLCVGLMSNLEASVLVTDLQQVSKDWQKVIEMNNGECIYKVTYSHRVDEEGNFLPVTDGKTSYSGLGLISPGSYNWYWCSMGFFDVVINKRHFLREVKADFKVVSQGKKGILDVVWDHDIAKVKARFVLLENTDYIMLEVSVKPKKDNTDAYTVCLMTLPHGVRVVSGPNMGKKDRWVATEKRNIHGGEGSSKRDRTGLSLEEENWIFYYDTLIKRSGPSALMFIPADPKNAALQWFDPASGNAVFTFLKYSTDTKAKLILWGWPKAVLWQDGLARFKENAASVLDVLKKENFKKPIKVRIEKGRR